jgi:Membrane bound beta barrel domain (DUF5777)
MKNKIIWFLLLFPFIVAAQDDLLSELEKANKDDVDLVEQTFKGTRLVNGQTMETKGTGELEFIFAHRFGAVNTGAYNLFGLDEAFVRIGLEYGITNRFGAGFGRNSVDKTMDGYLRYKLLAQSTGAKNVPVTVTAFTNAAIRTSPKKENATYDISLEHRMSYTTQLLIARKFSSALSLQLMPTYVHKNTVDRNIENNDVYIVGVGGRLKVSKSIALTTEYYHRMNTVANDPFKNPLGFGIDIETGGHVFQLVMTNTRGLTERAFLTETTGDFFKGDIHLGFNVTRTFQIKKQQ